MVFSEASLTFPLQAVISFLCFYSVSVDVHVQGKTEDQVIYFQQALGLRISVHRIYSALCFDGTYNSVLMKWWMEPD